jgi:hypothetical protein
MPSHDGAINRVASRTNTRKKAMPIGERIFSIRFPRFPILFYRRDREYKSISEKIIFNVCSKVKMGEPGGGGEERWEK